jgi:nucleotide-binding universal stress UspA family protein
MPHHPGVIGVLGQDTAIKPPPAVWILFLLKLHHGVPPGKKADRHSAIGCLRASYDSVFRNLLIADSGKGHVEEMVRVLRDIPPCRQARITLLHVVPEQGGDDLQAHRQRADSVLTDAVARIGLDKGDVTTLVREGDPKLTVLKVAEELDADLIVMGSRGLGRLQSILANSASQYVFQLSTRPMLLVRDDLYVRAINRVMVTVDGTGVGDDAMKLACELVREVPGASLTGVHVARQDLTPSRGGKSPADEVLEKAVQRARSFGVDLKPMHRTGDVARSVCAAAEEARADLLVIASQDRRPLVARALVDLDRLLSTSVSDYIRVNAPAPVLLVREPEGRST